MDAADRSYWKGNKRAPKRDGVLDVVSSAFNPALNASSWAACVEALRTITIPAVRAMAERAAKAESSFSDERTRAEQAEERVESLESKFSEATRLLGEVHAELGGDGEWFSDEGFSGDLLRRAAARTEYAERVVASLNTLCAKASFAASILEAEGLESVAETLRGFVAQSNDVLARKPGSPHEESTQP